MRRRQWLAGAAGGLAALGHGGSAMAAEVDLSTNLPAVLRRPALATPLAPGAAMLALGSCGRRLVAAGERGIVLTSDDEGRQWTQARVPVQVSLTALAFADERQGWAAGHLGVLLHTLDGGSTWTLQLNGSTAAAQLLQSATDEATRKRAQQMVEEGPDKPFFDIAALGEGRAVAVGAYGLAFETRDGGKRWEPLSPRLPNPKNLHLYGVRRSGERLFIAGEQGLLLRSNDGGASFEALASPYKGSFFGLLAARSGTLITYGLRGHAFRSADGGSSWMQAPLGVPMAISAGIERADGALLLLAQNGDLLISRDDGRQFERQPATAPFPATALALGGDKAVVLAGLRGLRRMAMA